MIFADFNLAQVTSSLSRCFGDIRAYSNNPRQNSASRALLRGSLLFLIGLAAMALSPWYALAFVLLLIGGLGTAAFSGTTAPSPLRGSHPARNRKFVDSPLEETVIGNAIWLMRASIDAPSSRYSVVL